MGWWVDGGVGTKDSERNEPVEWYTQILNTLKMSARKLFIWRVPLISSSAVGTRRRRDVE